MFSKWMSNKRAINNGCNVAQLRQRQLTLAGCHSNTLFGLWSSKIHRMNSLWKIKCSTSVFFLANIYAYIHSVIKDVHICHTWAVYTENAEAQMHCCIPMGHLDAADARLTHMQKIRRNGSKYSLSSCDPSISHLLPPVTAASMLVHNEHLRADGKTSTLMQSFNPTQPETFPHTHFSVCWS